MNVYHWAASFYVQIWRRLIQCNRPEEDVQPEQFQH